jgi:hypothetical protein
VARNIAARVHKRSERRAPGARIDAARAVSDLLGDRPRVAWPEPDLDVCRCTLHSVPPAAVGVERGSVRVGERSLDTTPSVAINLPVAVGGSGCSAPGM